MYKNVLNCEYPNLLSSFLSPCMQATWFSHKAVAAETIRSHTRKYQLEFEVTDCLCSRGNVNQIARPRAPQIKQKSTKRWSLKQTLLGSAASRYNSWATIKLAMSSSTAPPHRMILCYRSRSPCSISRASLFPQTEEKLLPITETTQTTRKTGTPNNLQPKSNHWYSTCLCWKVTK